MIDQFTIDKIINAAQIGEVVGDFVSLKKRGVNLIGLCPFHDEKTPSFTVSPAKNICKCFGCGKGGSPVNFIMEHEHLSYYEALRYLAKKYNIEIIEKEVSQDEMQKRNDRESMFHLNLFAQTYFSDVLWNNDEGRSIGLAYFRERGFRDDVLQKFCVGYSLDNYDSFSKYAISKSYKKEYLLKTGLSTERNDNSLIDRFRGRVIFPVHTLSGKVVAFGGRILKAEDKTAKYLNSPESEIYHKSNELYGLFFAKQSIVKQDNCFLVEGYTDVLSMNQAGIENVVASSGTALTPGQIRLIHRFTKNITVLYDGDAAGVKASIRGIDLLLEEGMNVKVVLLPLGEDPDSFSRKMNASEFIAYIEEKQTDFIHFKSQLLLEEAGKDVAKKAKLIIDIVQSIAIVPEAIMRSVYIKECAKLFEMNENILFTEVNKRRQNLMENSQKSPNTSYQESSALPQESDSAPIIFDNDKIDNNTFIKEQNLIRCLLRDGASILMLDTNDESDNVRVIDYILHDLAADDLHFSYPLHQQIVNELLLIENLNQQKIESYFLNHASKEMMDYVFQVMTEKYTLSKVHQKFKPQEPEKEKLRKDVIKYLLDFKEQVVMTMCDNLNLQIKKIQKTATDEELDQLMAELKRWLDIRREIAKHSEKTIIKI